MIDYMGEPTMPTPCPVGPGGNQILVNQDESEILEATVMHVGIREAPDAMYQENDSFVTGVYRENDVAGS
jgi:hypothetical protein